MRVEAGVLEKRPEREGDARSLDEPCGRSGIEVEDDLRRLARRLDAPRERMQLDDGLVCEPDERWEPVDHAEAQRPVAAARGLEHRKPARLALALVLVPAD